LSNLGSLHQRQGHYNEATAYLEQALPLHRESGDRTGEAETLNTLGEVLHGIGESDKARSRHTSALAVALHSGDRREQARAHRGLAGCYAAASDHSSARQHLSLADGLTADHAAAAGAAGAEPFRPTNDDLVRSSP
jgi:Flp pilus assembly protein TadD